MDAADRFRNARPGERLQRAGMSRDAVGAQYQPGQTQTPPAPERGLTYPIRVTSASSEILPADSQRRFLFIQNNDPVGNVTVSFGGNAAVLGIGFNLAAGGGGILLDNNVPSSRVFVIGSIAINPNVTMVVA